jgi:hypothetical protein
VAIKQVFRAAFFGASLAISSAALPALAQQYTPLAPVITAPSASASVASPVTVSYSLGDGDYGQQAGGGQGGYGGGWSGGSGGHHHTPHAYLVIDSATPAAGSSIQADADHIAFPAGQFQLSVPLSPGQHQLQIVFINRKGQVSGHIRPSAPVSISVQ